MGFGHRVYKNYDPRAKLMRETCYEVLEELGLHDDRIFKLAMALEKIALEDDYFVSRKLYPNVDFYSGIVQRALGIPVSMLPAFFRSRARWLDCPVAGDDRRSRVQDRPATPALHRRHARRSRRSTSVERAQRGKAERSTMSAMKEFLSNSYLFGANAPFIEELYEAYLDNPQSVPSSGASISTSCRRCLQPETIGATWPTRR